MPTIEFDDDWNSSSALHHQSGRRYNNHESNISKEDMEVLVKLIQEIPGMDSPSDVMSPRIKQLADCFAGTGTKTRIKVMKGIHQRNTEVHFTIALPPIGSGEGNFEIMLSAVDKFVKTGRSTTKRFEYVPVAITMTTKGHLDKFPPNYVYVERGDHGGIGKGRARGKSISYSTGNSSMAPVTSTATL